MPPWPRPAPGRGRRSRTRDRVQNFWLGARHWRGCELVGECEHASEIPPRRGKAIACGCDVPSRDRSSVPNDSECLCKRRARVPRYARDDSIFAASASSRRTPAITTKLSSRAQRGTFPTAAKAICDCPAPQGAVARKGRRGTRSLHTKTAAVRNTESPAALRAPPPCGRGPMSTGTPA